MKEWFDWYYSFPIAGTVAITVLVLVLISAWLTTKRKFLLSVVLFLSAQYLLRRGLYTLNTDSLVGIVISTSVYFAELYNLAHIAFFVHQAWTPHHRPTPSFAACRP